MTDKTHTADVLLKRTFGAGSILYISNSSSNQQRIWNTGGYGAAVGQEIDLTGLIIKRIDFYIWKGSAGTGTISAQIYDTSGGLICNSSNSYTSSQIGWSGAWYPFYFNQACTGTVRVVVSTTAYGSGLYYYAYQDSNVASGNRVELSSGGTWTSYASHDSVFAIYGAGYTADTVLIQRLSKNHTADCEIIPLGQKRYYADSLLTLQKEAQHTADTIISVASQAIKLEQNIEISGMQLTGNTDIKTTYATSLQSAQIVLDTSLYDVNDTYYFEAVFRNDGANATSLYLTNSNGENEATIPLPASTTTATRVRVALSPNNSYPNKRLTVATAYADTYVYNARIIILQTNPSRTSCIHSIGTTTTTTATAYAAPPNIAGAKRKLFKYVASEWNPAPTCYLEAVMKNSASGTNYCCFKVKGATTAIAEVTTSGTTVTYVRSSAFSLTDGTTYEIDLKASSGTATIYQARLVLVQATPPTKTVVYKTVAREYTSTSYNQQGRVLYTAANWSSSTLIYHQSSGYETATDVSNDAELGNTGTTDTATTGYATLTNSGVNFGATGTNWVESSALTLTDTYRYIAKGLEADTYVGHSCLAFKVSATRTIEDWHTADLILKAVPNKTYTADVQLGSGSPTISKDYTADVLVRTTETLAHTADSLVKLIAQEQLTADALIKKAGIEAQYTADILLRATEELTHTGDTLLRATFSKSYSSDALLRKTLELTHTADALIKGTQSLAFTADVLLRQEESLTYTADSVLALRLSKAYTADCYIGGFIGELGNAVAVSRTLRVVATVRSLRSSASTSTLRASGQASGLRANAISSSHKVSAKKEVLS